MSGTSLNCTEQVHEVLIQGYWLEQEEGGEKGWNKKENFYNFREGKVFLKLFTVNTRKKCIRKEHPKMLNLVFIPYVSHTDVVIIVILFRHKYYKTYNLMH